MYITIDLMEVASELAHEIVCARFEDDAHVIYDNSTDTIAVYSEQAQILFDEWYDYYYNFLFNLKRD
jgi:hypothetical protein